MLRRQPADFDASSFLSGHSEMARRIREFDWSDHPLGPYQAWPGALRSALGIALNSAFPTCIYWGSQLRLLYNDTWSLIPGPRHPGCLGEPASEVWSDIWHVIEPQLTQVISTGEGLNVYDQMLPMRRFGMEEETYWNYNFTPILMDDGSIGGIFNSGSETTHAVLQQRNTEFLLELSDLFRSMRDMHAVRADPLALLGAHLGADRVGLRERSAPTARADLPVVARWSAPGVPVDPPDDHGPVLPAALWKELLDGHVIRLDGTDPRRRAVEKDVLDAVRCASLLAVPWIEDGRTEAVLFIHSLTPRHWMDLEVQTVEAVLERMMHWIERTRSTERERVMSREIDHRARNLLSVVGSIVRLARPEDPKVMKAKLMDRITALAKTHSLMSEQRWEPVSLSQIIDQELAPYGGADGVAISRNGPPVVLTPDQSQSLALVLHELVTNAAKHGALAAAGGRLDVTWAMTPDEHLRIHWAETANRKIDPDGGDGTGFGARLLGRVIEFQLDGSFSQQFTPTGLHCVIDMPWSVSEEAVVS